MKLTDLHTALQQTPPPGDLSRLETPFANLTALEMLTKILGLPLSGLDLPPPMFAERFPNTEIPTAAQQVFGKDIKRYRVWRRLVLDSQILALPGQVDLNPWHSLRRITRLAHSEWAANVLCKVAATLPNNMPPQGLTRAVAIKAEAGLRGNDRQGFRAGLSALDRLHDNALIVATGLLPGAPIGPLPRPTAHTTHAPLPSRLQAYYVSAPTRAKAALPFVWRIATLAGVFETTADPGPADLVMPETLRRLQVLDPGDFGFQRPTKHSYLIYLYNLRGDLAPDDTGPVGVVCDPVKQAWKDLRTALRSAGVYNQRLNLLSHIATAAQAEGLIPSDLTPMWFQRALAALPPGQRNPFRAGCYFLDALRADPNVPMSLLPRAPTGVERQRAEPGSAKPKSVSIEAKRFGKQFDPVELAWIELFSEARGVGAAEQDLHCLYKLKNRALTCGLKPEMITLVWAEKIRDAAGTEASAIGTAVRLLDRLRAYPALTHRLPVHPIGALSDRRRTAGQLPPSISNELDELNSLRGIQESGCRSARIAIAALIEAAGIDDPTLGDVLALDFETIDWRGHRDQAERYVRSLSQMREFQNLPWTPDWLALQRMIVAAGVRINDNPVPALLTRVQGLGPRDLTKPRAQKIDRWLRAPNALSHHGRADLAKTFARNIARLDRLHDIPRLAALGILPKPIGPIRG